MKEHVIESWVLVYPQRSRDEGSTEIYRLDNPPADDARIIDHGSGRPRGCPGAAGVGAQCGGAVKRCSRSKERQPRRAKKDNSQSALAKGHANDSRAPLARRSQLLCK